MAGKTLTGIGEDESGKHLAADTSEASLRADKTPSTRSTDKMPLSARSTDRMPLSTIIGAPVPAELLAPVPEPSPVPAPSQMPAPSPVPAPSQMPVVDDDKVAEGLKKLRSLDEPLGPIPSSMPTLKEGIPALGPPTPADPATVAAAAAAEIGRSRGTAHGHALSAAAGHVGTLPVAVDDRMKGTLHGHSLHLPDTVPAAEPESRPAETREIARTVPPTSVLVAKRTAPDFSKTDSRIFESEPVNTDHEPENPRGKMMARGAVFVAVLSIFIVAAIAWVRAGKSESQSPADNHAIPPLQPIVPSPLDDTPSAAAPGGAPGNSAPTEAPGSAVPAPAGAAPAPAPPAPVAPAETKPEPEPSAPPAHTRPRHNAATSVSKPETTTPSHAPATPHTAAPATTPSDTKPAPPGKRGKSVEDPDGTLPLTE